MKDKPSILDVKMIQALLNGKKKHYVPIEPHPNKEAFSIALKDKPFRLSWWPPNKDGINIAKPKHGVIGQIVWVRESWRKDHEGIHFKASEGQTACLHKWKAPILLKKSDARIRFVIMNLRAKFISDLVPQDAIDAGHGSEFPLFEMRQHIEEYYPDYEWHPNVLLWEYEIKRIK